MINPTIPGTSIHQIGKYEVELFYKSDIWWPHAFEVVTKDTTQLSGYHASGSLEIEGDIVTGYDGVYSLPLPVAIALANLGLGFAPFVFPTENAEHLLRQ